VLQFFSITIAPPKFLRCRIPGDSLLKASEIIEFNRVWPVARIRELQTQHFRVQLCLLQTIGCGFVFRLCFNNREWKISAVSKQIINSLRWSTNKAFADWNDPTVGDRPLLRYRVRFVIPTGGL